MKKVPLDFCRLGHVRPTAYVREAYEGHMRVFDTMLTAGDARALAKWITEEFLPWAEPTVQSDKPDEDQIVTPKPKGRKHAP